MGFAITIGFAQATVPAPAQGAGAPLPGPTVAVNALPLSPAIFDSGAARGANAADIPLSGSTDAPDGAVIEARLVVAATGAGATPWQPVASAAGGLWSGVYPAAARSPHMLRVQVRLQSDPARVASAPGEIAIGHVVALIGQSEDARMFADEFDRPAFQAPPALGDAPVLFVLRKNGGTYAAHGIEPVTGSTPVTSALAHLADVLDRAAPGEKILIVEGTQSGTTYHELAHDSPDGFLPDGTTPDDRDWATSFADGIALVRSYGGDVGVVLSSWTAGPSQFGDNYRRYLYPLFSGRHAPDDPTYAGADYEVGSTIFGDRVYDHLLWDLTGRDRAQALFTPATKMAFFGPHRFEDAVADRQQKEDTRLSIRNMVDDPELAPIMLPKGPEILAYQNGTPTDSAGRKSFNPDPGSWVDWVDYAHPSDYSADGLPARARHTAVAALYALGLGPQAAQRRDVPRFNRADWAADGAHVDLWWEDATGAAPAITTTRLARGLPAIPDTYPHRTEVAGFTINGQPAQRVEIAGGGNRIRVYPNDGPFTYSDVIRFGTGGASGVVQFPEDAYDAIWMNLPIVDVGIPGIEGVAIEPMPRAGDIASTLSAPATFSVVTDNGPWFRDTADSAMGGQLTVQMRLQLTADMRGFLAAMANRFTLEYITSAGGRLRSQIRDSAGAHVMPSGAVTNLTVPAPQIGQMVTVTASVDLEAGVADFYVGSAHQRITLRAGTGLFDGDVRFSFFNNDIDTNDIPSASVAFARVWKAYTPDGTTGALGAPYAEITGANQAAHPWRHAAAPAP